MDNIEALLAARYLAARLSLDDALLVARLAFYTLVRVAVLIVVASLIWVPVGVWIGLNPRWTVRAPR